MSIQDDLSLRLKEAMKAKDQPTLDVIRMIRAKITEARTAKGFSGEVDDALYVRVIEQYVKTMEKAKEDYVGQGERAEEMIRKIQFEIDFLTPYLPKRLSEADTQALVEAAVAELGAVDPKQAGRIMGAIMKSHKADVDPAVLKAVVDRVLSKG